MSARLVALFVLFAAPAVAADPKPLTPPDLDKIAVEALRDVHDRGADLYNAADAAAAQRLYEGALRTVSPFLAHRPKTQGVIADGLAEAARRKGPKEQAYRLHEIIEEVRTDLKAAIRKADAENKGEEKKPDVEAKRAEPPKPVTGTLGGAVTLDGKPLAKCSVTVVSLDLPLPRVFTAAADAAGTYTFADPLPVGNYAAMITDGGAVTIPSRYQSTRTSGLVAAVKGVGNTVDLALQSN